MEIKIRNGLPRQRRGLAKPQADGLATTQPTTGAPLMQAGTPSATAVPDRADRVSMGWIPVWEGIGLQQAWESDAFEGRRCARAGRTIPAQKGNHQHGERHAEGQPAHVIAPEARIGLPLIRATCDAGSPTVYPTLRYTLQRRRARMATLREMLEQGFRQGLGQFR